VPHIDVRWIVDGWGIAATLFAAGTFVLAVLAE
jgi:hypothetical protein